MPVTIRNHWSIETKGVRKRWNYIHTCIYMVVMLDSILFVYVRNEREKKIVKTDKEWTKDTSNFKTWIHWVEYNLLCTLTNYNSSFLKLVESGVRSKTFSAKHSRQSEVIIFCTPTFGITIYTYTFSNISECTCIYL